MPEKKDNRNSGDKSVQLNEAFERLEKQKADAEGKAEKKREKDRGKKQEAAAPATRGPDEAPMKSGGSPLGGLGLFIALIAIGVASFSAWQLYTMQNAPDTGLSSRINGLEQKLAERPTGASEADVAAALERLTSLEREVTRSISAAEDTRARLDAVTADLAARDAVSDSELEELKARISEAMTGLRNELGTSPQDWLLAEVEYLLRLGAQRVEMQHDAVGALAAFTAADDILRSTEGVAAFGLREAIANDIAELQAVDTVDVDGIFVRLGAMKRQVDRLRQTESSFTPKDVTLAEAGEESGYLDQLGVLVTNVGSRLASLVDYRRDAERVRPILPPREEYYLRQNLTLKLQMAQFALLRENQEIYAASLAEAGQWVERYFDPDDALTQTMKTSLSELQGLSISQEMPDVSESLREARQMLQRFNNESQRNLVQ